MVARIATFEGVDIGAAERTLDAAHERLDPLFRGMAGWQGLLELVDRASGKVMTITLFESEDAMQAAEPTFEEEMPRQLGDLMAEWSGRRTSVERYEVVSERRPGA
jgi:hypothetical protein